MTVRESLEVLIEKKLHKFDKFFGEDTEALVTCRTRKGAKIIEITVNYGQTVFRAEEESETFITALDRAIEGLERQIRKNKTRLEKTVRSGAFVIEEDDDDDFYEVECPSCGEVVCFDSSVDPDDVTCPACGEKFSCVCDCENCDACDEE